MVFELETQKQNVLNNKNNIKIELKQVEKDLE